MLTVLIAIATSIGAFVVSLAALMLFTLAVPGAKGYPTRRKTAQFVGLTPSQARDHLAERLRRIGCDVHASESPPMLVAARPSTPRIVDGAMMNTHADRALKITVELAQHGASTLARTTVRINEFTLVDTGEVCYAQGVLDWLTDSRDRSMSPPCPPTTSAEALVAFTNAATSLAAWALPLRLNWPPDRAPAITGFALGLGFLSLLAIAGARAAFRAIGKRPDQLTGKALATISILIALVGLLVSATVLVLYVKAHGITGLR